MAVRRGLLRPGRPVPGPAVTIGGDLDAALESTPVLPRDAVAVMLARRYAEALDDCFDALAGVARPCPRCRTTYDEGDAVEDGAAHARVVLEISRLGGRLEAMLDRLGMAPSARPAVPGGGGGIGGPTPAGAALSQLERDAAAGAPASGVDYAAHVDPAVTGADAEE
jgi:hypothetical protein